MSDEINRDDEINCINKTLIKTQLIGAPGMIMVGLGLYGAFSAKGEVFHPLLDNMLVSFSLLAVGAAIAIWVTRKVGALSKRRAQL